MNEIIFKYCLGLGLSLSRSILSITRKRLAFDSVKHYFILLAEKPKKTYNVIKLKKGVGTDSATAEANYNVLHYKGY